MSDRYRISYGISDVRVAPPSAAMHYLLPLSLTIHVIQKNVTPQQPTNTPNDTLENNKEIK